MAKAGTPLAEALCEIGCKKTKLPLDRMFVLGVLAGVYIGFGSQLATTVTQDLANYVGVGLSQFMGGAELFTGNSLISVACCARNAPISGLLKNWVVVYIANLVGSVLLAYIVFQGGSMLWVETL